MNIPYVEFRTKPALLTYHDLGLNYVSNFQVKNLHHQKCFRSGFSKIFESTNRIQGTTYQQFLLNKPEELCEETFFSKFMPVSD